jgi:integration host factor subunit alpha
MGFGYRIEHLATSFPRGRSTVTKADIIEDVYEKVGFSKKEAAEIVELVFDTIKETLERGEKIKVSGFGNFIVRDKKSRVGRNPQTGEEIEISARRVLTFRPSQVLKNALNLSAEAAAAAGGAGTPPAP